METSQRIETRGAYVSARLDLPPSWMMLLASPLKTIIYLWCGVFWIWMLVECLSDYYPVFKPLLETLFGSASLK